MDAAAGGNGGACAVHGPANEGADPSGAILVRFSAPFLAQQLTHPNGVEPPAYEILTRLVPSVNSHLSMMWTLELAGRLPASQLSISQPTRILSLLLATTTGPLSRSAGGVAAAWRGVVLLSKELL